MMRCLCSSHKICRFNSKPGGLSESFEGGSAASDVQMLGKPPRDSLGPQAFEFSGILHISIQ